VFQGLIRTVQRKNLKEEDHMEQLGIEGWETLRRIIKKQPRRAWDVVWLRTGTNGRLF
jgi:hypothetical protein